LSRCLRFLKPGGIEPAENEQLVASILESTPGYEPVKLRHSFPPDDQMDGAFAAAIRRI
jgi:16S rRNA C967 or C1407 C5-methylase (RsmB/RsmF family)